MRLVNGVTLAGKAVGLNAALLTAAVVLHQIKAKNACVQINTDIDKGKLKLDWNLVYSPSALEHPERDEELTRAKVRDREERTLRSDKLHVRPINLACDRRGNVYRVGKLKKVFTEAVAVGGR
jgi:hypothetical protein